MSRAPTAKLRAYVALTGAGALAGLTLGYPELVALAAPFAAYVALGLALDRRPEIVVSATIDNARVLEAGEISIAVQIRAGVEIERLEVELRPGPGLTVPSTPRRAFRLLDGETRELHFKLRAGRWGRRPAGTLQCRARGRFGLIAYEKGPLVLGAVRVFPRPEALSAMIAPLELQATSGSRVSRARGEGIEFAEVRPFVPGDRVRRINWRVSARRGAPFVSERHPEKNADVILFLDTFAEVRDAAGGTLDLAVRAAAALAAGYLAQKDRVGVVGFGGVLSGIGPRLGVAQLYRILDALMGSEVVFSYAQKDVNVVPRRMLPPKALVIAITPLIDERSVAALLDLRARGFDMAVLDVSPVRFVKPGRTDADALAHRLWLLRRGALKAHFEELGVPVAEWAGEQPLQATVFTASLFRRRLRQPVAA
jgi:uncharacterized protein (DUF58 family)